MKFTGKSYYVGLLSAAALYGAAHQQPQEFFVITTLKQSITREKNLKINYITKKTIPFDFIKKIQTESGFVNVSYPQLTASDLIYYSKQIGGINRVCTVLNELCESLNPDDFTGHFIEILTIPTIQRLGFIFEKILFKKDRKSVV